MTIYATWRGGPGLWRIAIPKDRFWGDAVPEPGDEVIVIRKDGQWKTVYLGMPGEDDDFCWYFYEDPDPFGEGGRDDYDYCEGFHDH